MVFGKAIWNWIWSSERRRHTRRDAVRLAAFYWEPAAAQSHRVKDISRTGMYVLTEDRWYPNTLVTMTLTRADVSESAPKRSVRVMTRVIRSGADGVAVAFVWPGKVEQSESELDGQKTVYEFLDEFETDYVGNLAGTAREGVRSHPRTLLGTRPGFAVRPI